MSLVLFSGGLDSTVALYEAIEVAKHPELTLGTDKPEPVHALTFHYGQRHIKELGAADRIALMAGVQHRIVVIPPALMPNKESSLLVGARLDVVRKYDHIPSNDEADKDPAFIPYRNLLFLTVAASYARSLELHEVVTGLRGGFPDCTQAFELAVFDTLAISDPSFAIEIYSPCHDSRAETIGLAYSLPGCWQALAYSMTCFEGTEPPCGKCLPCLKRAEGFEQFGKPDPLLERLRVEQEQGAYEQGAYRGP